MCSATTSHPFELWQLGETRQEDLCISRYQSLDEARRDHAACAERLPDECFEIRSQGAPLRSFQPAARERRSTRATIPAVERGDD
ncbi:MAG: hypothetical protein R3B72_21020 [Polyangiaceae bacterium]